MSEILDLPLGSLSSLSALSATLAGPLENYSRWYGMRSQHREPVEPRWDLRGLEYRRISIAALTAFVAVAHRLRLFTRQAPPVRLSWNPQVLGFLEDTGIIDILRQNDLVDFSADELAGYFHEVGKTNPNSRFFLFGRPWPDFREVTGREKDAMRTLLVAELRDYTRGLFRPSRWLQFRPELAGTVLASCAELVINSHIWGRSSGAVGLQRTSKRITAAIADCGDGLLQGLSHHELKPNDHCHALLLAVTHNKRAYGLWRAINDLLQMPGASIYLWSYDSELFLRLPLWNTIRNLDLEALRRVNPLPVELGRVSEEQRRLGYLRKWKQGVRGVRISFEISL